MALVSVKFQDFRIELILNHCGKFINNFFENFYIKIFPNNL